MSNPSVFKIWLDDILGNSNSRLWVKENWNLTKK
jgi:hypothetical protein